MDELSDSEQSSCVSVNMRPCPCCEGAGCSECDQTGQRVTTYIEGDGAVMRVSGAGVLCASDQDALREIGRVAVERAFGREAE